MTKDEALKMALVIAELRQAHAGHTNEGPSTFSDAADLLEALAQPEQEPVGKLQEATAERAWFTIDELNAWADKKLSENPHWVMPKDEPERDEPPPKREWVGLTDEERINLSYKAEGNECVAVELTEDLLKEKNT